MNPKIEAADCVVSEQSRLYAEAGWVESLRAEYFSEILDPTSKIGSYQRFYGLSGEKAGRLLAALPEEAGVDRQNQSPRLKDLLAAATNHRDRVYLCGYLIDASRWDERITVDTLIFLDEFGTMAPIGDIGDFVDFSIPLINRHQKSSNMLKEDFSYDLLLHYYYLRHHKIDYRKKLKAYQQIASILGIKADEYPPDEIHFGNFPYLQGCWGWRIWWD